VHDVDQTACSLHGCISHASKLLFSRPRSQSFTLRKSFIRADTSHAMPLAQQAPGALLALLALALLATAAAQPFGKDQGDPRCAFHVCQIYQFLRYLPELGPALDAIMHRRYCLSAS
jgi:hypothetical protein